MSAKGEPCMWCDGSGVNLVDVLQFTAESDPIWMPSMTWTIFEADITAEKFADIMGAWWDRRPIVHNGETMVPIELSRTGFGLVVRGNKVFAANGVATESDR